MSKLEEIKNELDNEPALIKCAEEFSLVGDPTRMKICYLLCRHGELSVSEIAELVGVSISAVSHTLRKLRNADIVEKRREFRVVHYRLKRTPFTDILANRIEAL